MKMKIKIISNFFLILVVFLNCKAQQNSYFIKLPKVIFRNQLPMNVRDEWQHLDIEKDTLAGTSLNRAYQEIIKNKKGKSIIVAVIDNYTDIYHEDIKDAIWVNKKEIPNNSIDDDHNGYIDDIHGWNFLGNRKGDDVVYANSESTRFLRYLKNKYPNYPNFNKNKKDSTLYIQATNRYNSDREYMNFLKTNNAENLKKYRKGIKNLNQIFNKSNFSIIQYDSLNEKNGLSPEIKESIAFMRSITRFGKNYELLKIDSLKIENEIRISYNENYYDRVSLEDNNETNSKYNQYGSNNMYKNAKENPHGTIVAGIIGAKRANKIGINGFSDHIKIMPIRTTPSGGSEHDKDVALAIRYAVDNGAKVINMSFGKTSCLHPEWIKEAFQYAAMNDVLLVAGSGNDSKDNDIYPFYPIDYDLDSGKEYCNNFIKVGSVTMDGDKNFVAPYSNYGKKTVDVFAPGYFLKTTDPNVGYSYQDGTSMASPIVCGVAALVRSYYPKLTVAQVKQIILDSGVAYDNLQVQVPGEKEGVLKPFSEMSKSGKVVNVYNALLMAKEMNKKKK
jgi:cell wall-associated protease